MGERFGGRQKGTPNKFTAKIKDAIENAFEEVGGQKYLVRLAISEPQVFCKLLGQVLPKDIHVEAEVTLRGILEDMAAEWSKDQSKK